MPPVVARYRKASIKLASILFMSTQRPSWPVACGALGASAVAFFALARWLKSPYILEPLTVPLSKTAVVTGAASGIGKETAQLLLLSGWHVIAIDFDQKGLRRLQTEHHSQRLDDDTSHDSKLSVICADLSSSSGRNAAVAEVQLSTSKIDALVHVAGAESFGAGSFGSGL